MYQYNLQKYAIHINTKTFKKKKEKKNESIKETGYLSFWTSIIW